MQPSITIWHYAGCGTCKKALGWFRSTGLQAQLIDLVTEQPPTVQQLAQVRDAAGVTTTKLFNVSGQVYREEGWAEQVKSLPDAALLAALAGRGKLIKRPLLLVVDGPTTRAAVGFAESSWTSALAPYLTTTSANGSTP